MANEVPTLPVRAHAHSYLLQPPYPFVQRRRRFLGRTPRSGEDTSGRPEGEVPLEQIA